MKHGLKNLWHTGREYFTHWMVAGAILAATGAAPEHWLADVFHDVHLPTEALHLWAAEIDLRVVIAGLGLALLVGDIAWRRTRPVPVIEPSLAVTSVPADAAPPLPGKPSIAVLAFTNMSGDIDQEYFSDGIAEDIITQLSHCNALFVIARNSSFTYKGHATDVKQIGRELGVRYVLEGSVRRDGERVRINAQLVEAETGNHVWAERFDRVVTDIFGVQDEIAGAVARAIEPEISRAEQQRMSRKPPESLGAWEAYQRGRWHVDKANAADHVRACEFFQQAIRLDPSFTLAYAELAHAYLNAGVVLTTMPLHEALALATKYADAALAIDARDAATLAALGRALYLSGHAEAAAVRYDQALSIDPNHPRVRRLSGSHMIFDGRPAEGRAVLLGELRLDPRSRDTVVSRLQIAMSYYFEGDYAASAGGAEQCIAAHPGIGAAYRVLAASFGQLGRREEAAAALRRVLEISPDAIHRYVSERPPWTRPVDYEHMLDGLRKAGWQG